MGAHTRSSFSMLFSHSLNQNLAGLLEFRLDLSLMSFAAGDFLARQNYELCASFCKLFLELASLFLFLQRSLKPGGF